MTRIYVEKALRLGRSEIQSVTKTTATVVSAERYYPFNVLTDLLFDVHPEFGPAWLVLSPFQQV